MKTKNIKVLFKLLLFFCGLGLLIFRMNSLFILKEYPAGANVNILINQGALSEKQEGFYSLEKDSLDVIFIGSSNVHCNINPNVIWHNYGITSYDFSCDQQELGTSYYYLEQSLKTQKPQVVVIDVMGKMDSEMITDPTRAHYAFDFMRLDEQKIKAIHNRVVKENRLEIYFPLLRYHGRWKELTRTDYLDKGNYYNPLKGTFIYMLTNEFEKPIIPNDIPYSDMNTVAASYMDEIAFLCQENGCDCLFIKTPYATYSDYWFSYFDAVDRYCDEKGYSFLNMNNLTEEIGLDYSNDYTDDMHMNWNGQQKTSIFLGEYLSSNYDIQDKRMDDRYSYWNDDYETMMYYIDNFWTLWWEMKTKNS